MIERADRSFGKALPAFFRNCLIPIGVALLLSMASALGKSDAAPPEAGSQGPLKGTADTLKKDSFTSEAHREDGSTQRTLEQYYSRRQYLGAPPELPHPVAVHGKQLECLVCHTDGGWTDRLKKITPVTPHPGHTSCMQCHVWPVTDTLFRTTGWQSLPPPRLGRAYLPGAPPPIPHSLQMRKNCNACHVGPATVPAISMKHKWQGSCWQCHVEESRAEPFRR